MIADDVNILLDIARRLENYKNGAAFILKQSGINTNSPTLSDLYKLAQVDSENFNRLMTLLYQSDGYANAEGSEIAQWISAGASALGSLFGIFRSGSSNSSSNNSDNNSDTIALLAQMQQQQQAAQQASQSQSQNIIIIAVIAILAILFLFFISRK